MYNAICTWVSLIGRTTSAGLATSSGASNGDYRGHPTSAAQAGYNRPSMPTNKIRNRSANGRSRDAIPAWHLSQGGRGIYTPTQHGPSYTPLEATAVWPTKVSRRGLLASGRVAILAAGTGIYLFSHEVVQLAPVTQSDSPLPDTLCQ